MIVWLTVRRAVLALSLLLNAVLAGLTVQSNRQDEIGDSTSPLQLPAARAIGEQDNGTYYQTLLDRGLSDAEAKTLLLARLEGEARAAAGPSTSNYWQSTGATGVEVGLRRLDELDQIREGLTDLFGAKAAPDPVLRGIFRPLGPEFSFLTSTQQIEIQRLRLKQQAASVEAAKDSRSAGRCQIDLRTSLSPGRPTKQTPFVADLANVLEEPTLTEYLLRDSSLAAQLRASRIDFTEKEFRETFGILRRLEESPGSADVYTNARNELRKLLGDRRFAGFWASRDPLYGVFERAAESNSLTEDTLAPAYELFAIYEDDMARAAKVATVDPERAHTELAAARARLQRQLAGLIGQDATDDFLRRYAQEMAKFTRAVRQQSTPR